MTRLHGLLAGCALSVLSIASGASAQDAKTAAGAAAPKTAEVDTLVVTGSRIARSDYVAESPIVTVQNDALTATAAVTLEESLNQMPQFSAANSSSINLGTNQANLNLRGLGTQRTLVLLDGRRLQPSNADNSVDVTTLPTALIQSVEVITGGASAVYGSDAVAGVVNFKLNTKFNGIQLDAKYGETGKSDGQSSDIAITLGGGFADDRGHAVFSIGHTEREPVDGTNRPFFALANLSTTLVGGGVPKSTNTAFTQAAIDQVFAKYGFAAGTVKANANTFGVNSDGTLYSTGGQLVNYKGCTTATDPTCNLYVAPGSAILQNRSGQFRLIQTSLNKNSAFGHVEYDLTPKTKVFAEFNFSDYTSSAGLEPVGANASIGLTISPNNVFVPADLKALLNSRPDPTAPFAYLTRLAQFGNRAFSFQHSDYQITVGAKGEVGVGDLTWDTYFSNGHDRTVNKNTGFESFAPFESLLSAADGGNSICAGGYNPFSTTFVPSQACKNLVNINLLTVTTFDQTDAAANIQGRLFALPAGDVRFAAGVDYRKNTYNYSPDQGTATGAAINALPSLGSAGSENVKEAYVEALVPLLKDLPLVEELDADLAYRISDYNTIGSVSTYKASGDWNVGQGLRLRASVQRAIRAPSVGELYAANSAAAVQIGNPSAGGTSGDPCDIRSSYRLGANAAKVRALCLAEGIPASIIDSFTNTINAPFISQGGNATLRQETADSYTVGGVWRSHLSNPLLSSLSASVDYYNIEVKSAIATIGFPQSLQGCFNADGKSNATYDSANQLCKFIQRSTTNGLFTQGSQQPLFNIGQFKTDGVDLELDYAVNLSDLGLEGDTGRFTVNAVATRLLSFTSKALPSSPELDYAGTIGAGLTNPYSLAYPDWKAQLNLTYTLKRADIGVRLRYLSSMHDSSTVSNPASTTAGVPAYTYVDLLGTYRLTDNIVLRAGVTNLGDKQPPVVGGVPGFTDQSTYDLLGRSYYASLRLRF